MKSSVIRRTFLRDSLMIAGGLTAGTLLSSQRSGSVRSNRLQAAQASASAEERLRELGIELPAPPTPVAVYVPVVRSGNMLYASGHGPLQANGEYLSGKVGDQMTLDQGYAAARLTGLSMLSSVRGELGSLDRVVRLVKVLGMVNCTADFAQHPQVINGFSELMVQIFGPQNGKAARSAVGMNSLPSNIPVEIEAIFEVES